MTDTVLIDDCHTRFENWVNRRWAVWGDKPDLLGFVTKDKRYVYYSEQTSLLFSAYHAGEYYAPKQPTEGTGNE